MTHNIELGPLEGNSSRPVFRASADGVDFLVELDTSAVGKLRRNGRADWREAVEAERGRIRAAAQDLYNGGFLTEADEGRRLFVTAIDIV